jgi:hypothetical protein
MSYRTHHGDGRAVTFLECTDLDELMRASQALSELDADDVAQVRAVLSARSDRQALANLLFYPYLIPDELRIPTLLAALAPGPQPYFNLAAIVGLQEIDAEALDEPTRVRIRDLLLGIINGTNDVRAARASVTLFQFLSAGDAPRLAALLQHPQPTAAHNVLAWHLRTFAGQGEAALAAAFSPLGDGGEAAALVLAKLCEHQAQKAAGKISSADVPLLEYIPNLKDLEGE